MHVSPNVSFENATARDTTVYVSFGSDSVVTSATWTVCKGQPKLTCSFALPQSTTQALPTGGSFLNATIAFGMPVGCGATKAELNLNNPAWAHDTTDVSLVDGFNVPVELVVRDTAGVHTFTAAAATGNEKAIGVFPKGCDICVAREHPPCGISPGTDGCKAGTQYKPEPVCQYQGPERPAGGGSSVTVRVFP